MNNYKKISPQLETYFKTVFKASYFCTRTSIAAFTPEPNSNS